MSIDESGNQLQAEEEAATTGETAVTCCSVFAVAGGQQENFVTSLGGNHIVMGRMYAQVTYSFEDKAA